MPLPPDKIFYFQPNIATNTTTQDAGWITSNTTIKMVRCLGFVRLYQQKQSWIIDDQGIENPDQTNEPLFMIDCIGYASATFNIVINSDVDSYCWVDRNSSITQKDRAIKTKIRKSPPPKVTISCLTEYDQYLIEECIKLWVESL